MKAALFKDIQKIEIIEKPEPEVKENAVLMKVEYCGICGSDVHGYLNGVMVAPGTIMGHECSGTIVKTGGAVKKFRPGDRVVAKPIPQCGECYWCRHGQYSLCIKAFERGFGITPAHDGAYAEYLLVEYPDEMLFALPGAVTFQQGALVEPLSTSLHGVRMSRFKPGDSVVVIGAGMIGLGTIQFLKIGGAGRIIVLEVSKKKAQLAKEIGADYVLDPMQEGEGLRPHIFKLTGGTGADIVYECSGVPFGFQNGMFLAKSGGQVMIVGITDKETALNPFMLVLWEIEMKGVLGYYDEFPYVIRYLKQGKISTEAFISATIKLDELEEKGFKRLLATKDDVKILVQP